MTITTRPVTNPRLMIASYIYVGLIESILIGCKNEQAIRMIETSITHIIFVCSQPLVQCRDVIEQSAAGSRHGVADERGDEGEEVWKGKSDHHRAQREHYMSLS